MTTHLQNPIEWHLLNKHWQVISKRGYLTTNSGTMHSNGPTVCLQVIKTKTHKGESVETSGKGLRNDLIHCKETSRLKTNRKNLS